MKIRGSTNVYNKTKSFEQKIVFILRLYNCMNISDIGIKKRGLERYYRENWRSL